MSFFNKKENRKPLFALCLFAVAVTAVVIMLGAFTRLVDAGLGCPDWPTCYGHLWVPNTAEEIAAANAKEEFAHTPVETHKTWPEQIHRIFASSLGLIAIVLIALSFRSKHPEQPKKLPIFILFFVILQGMFGMWTVTLKVWPQVVTVHLLGGFTTISLFWLMVLRLDGKKWQLPTPDFEKVKSLKKFAYICFFIVIGQITLGGWTTSNYAAVACTDLPTCHGSWIPHMDFKQGFNIFQEIGPNYLGGVMDNEARIAIHFSHRVGAIVTTLFLSMLIFMMLVRKATRETKSFAIVLASVLTLQILLGLGNIVFQFPLWSTVSHNAGGALLLLVIVTLLYRLHTIELAGEETVGDHESIEQAN